MLAFRLLSLAPRPVRRSLVQALTPRQRRWLVQQVIRLRIGRMLLPRQLQPGVPRSGPPQPDPPQPDPPQPDPARRVRVRHAGTSVTAAIVAETSPVLARRRNLTGVMAALDAAGVGYFRVPHARDQRTTLAVPADQRDAALAALASPPLGDAEVRGWSGARRPRRVPVRGADIVEVFWPVVDVGRTMLLGTSVACDVEFWAAAGGALVSPRQPRTTPLVRRESPVLHAADRDFDQFCSATDDGARFPTRPELMLAGMDWVRFPVDAVYTWVDGSDPRWQERKEAALAANRWAADSPQTANAARYLSRDELRYSLRSLHYFAPWIRRVFVVTDAQVPAWLDTAYPRVTVVDHREIFGDAGRLPTFNSHAIETRLHHIRGLAEHFLYLNDDVFFGRPQTPDQYFLPNGIAKFFPSSLSVEAGPPRRGDPPVMCAGKNNRDVLARHFGRLLTQKIRHTPYPERRSVLAEIERRCPQLLLATAGRQFRHPDDVSVPASLQHYWSYLTGRAVPGEIEYMYTDVGDPLTPFRLALLLRRRNLDVFCVNDTDADEDAGHAATVGRFLPAYFPFPCPYELPAADRAGGGVARPRPDVDSPARLPAGRVAPVARPAGDEPRTTPTNAPAR